MKFSNISGTDTNASRLYTVSRFDIHPLYNEETLDNDIAIVTTNSIINFSEEVGPACLPFQHRFDSFAGSYVDLLGERYSLNHSLFLEILNFHCFTCKLHK